MLRINTFVVSHLKQGLQNIATYLCRTGLTGNTKAVTTTGYFDIEPAFYMTQVFVELTTQISQAFVIGGLEDDISRYLDGIQST